MSEQRQDILLKQHQKLHMTPELKQGLAVMSMSALELREYVIDRVAENPFLEEVDMETRDITTGSDTFVNHVNTESLYEQMLPRQRSVTDGRYGEIKQEYYFEKFMIHSQTIEEFLEQQLNFELKNEKHKSIGRFLIGSLDSNGYLRITLDEAAILLKTSPRQIKQVLHVLQLCDPAGIGASNLRECLLLQAKRDLCDTLAVRLIIQDYLEELVKHNYQLIAREIGISVTDVQDIHDYIATLDPRPGLSVPTKPLSTIRPEVLVVYEAGCYVVHLQEFDMPSLGINQDYVELSHKGEVDRKTNQYLAENLSSAKGLIFAIEQRRATMYKIAKSIVDLQQDFFEKGITELRPLTLAQIAQLTDCHESTVSRVVNGCYMQSPQGLFELKYFFHSGPDGEGGLTVSSKNIKNEIQKLVASENPQKPLSDSKIQESLLDQDIVIARRTINKYRKSLNIPAASERKRYIS